jgi:hypothetical protein
VDSYLLDPRMRGLSVKIRADRALEVKAYRGNLGILHVPGSAHGYLEAWQKWSFPFRPPSQAGAVPAGWERVRKRRRISRFSLAGGQLLPGSAGRAEEPGCAVELTEIRARHETWWTLGFEATGPPDRLRGGLEAASAFLFARAFPADAEMTTEDSKSYAEWLLPPGQDCPFSSVRGDEAGGQGEM